MKVLKLVLLLMTLHTTHLYAQEQPKLKPLQDIVVASITNTNYTTSAYSKDNTSGDILLREIQANFNFPIYMAKGNISVIGGVQFSNLYADFSKSSYIPLSSRNFYSFGPQFVVIKKLGTSSWASVLRTNTLYASDMKSSISSEALYYSVVGLLIKRQNNFFEYGFGAIYGNEFGGTAIYPVMHLIYKKKRWQTHIALPIRASVFYKFKKSKIGLSSDFARRIYTMKDDLSTEFQLEKMRNEKFNIGPEFETVLHKKIKLNLKAGVTISNKVEWFDDAANAQSEIWMGETYFIKIGLKLIHN